MKRKATISLDLGGLPHDPKQIKAMIRVCMKYLECDKPVRLVFELKPRQRSIQLRGGHLLSGTYTKARFGSSCLLSGIAHVDFVWIIGWAVHWAKWGKRPTTVSRAWADVVEAARVVQTEVKPVEPIDPAREREKKEQRLAKLIDKRRARRERAIAKVRANVATYEKLLKSAKRKLKTLEKSLKGYDKRGNKYREKLQDDESLIWRLKRKTPVTGNNKGMEDGKE